MANENVKNVKKEKKPNLFSRLGRFFKDVVGELKKVTWPTPKELINYTLTVFAFIVLFAVIIGVLDLAFGEGFKALGGITAGVPEETALAGFTLPGRV